MFKTLLCIPPDYSHEVPPLGTPALSAFLKHHGVPCGQIDLNLGYRDFLAEHVSGTDALSHKKRVFFLEPLLRKFFSSNLKDRYCSGLLPQHSDGMVPALPYG